MLANGNAYYEQVSETFLLFGDPAMALKVPLPRRPSGLVIEGQTDGIALQWQAAADGDGSVRSEMVSAGLAVPDTAAAVDVTGSGGGGGGGCFILTVAEPGVAGHLYWWMLATLALCLGVLKKGVERKV